MRWNEITIHTTDEAIEMISNFMHELGAGGVSIEEYQDPNQKRDTSLGQWYEIPPNNIPEGEAFIKGYFAETEEVNHVMQQLRESVDMLRDEIGIDTGAATIDVREVDEEDWANAWKQYYKPLRITDTITIKPTWEVYDADPEEIIIELDPGMAFGTGTHPTTALCLRTLEKVVQPGQDVIDVGTGSGVLAIAAAKFGARHVLAIDLDPVAVSSAHENIRLNQLENQVSVKHSDLLQIIRQSETDTQVSLGVNLPVQVVVANILAEIILLFLHDVYEVLESGGIYIVSGIYKNKEQDVEDGLTQAGFVVADKYKEQDWVAFVARKQ